MISVWVIIGLESLAAMVPSSAIMESSKAKVKLRLPFGNEQRYENRRIYCSGAGCRWIEFGSQNYVDQTEEDRMFINLSPAMIGIQTDLLGSLEIAKRHNFAGIDFSIHEVADRVDAADASEVRNHFSEAGVRAGNWSFPVNFRQDAGSWEEGVAQLPRLAKAAEACGFTRTSTWILPGDDDRSFPENFQFHVERLRPCAQILAEHGIAFGLEWVGTKTLRSERKYSFIHTMEGMLELGEALGTGNVGLLVDSFHIFTSHGNNEDIRHLRKEQVVNVHVNDAIEGVPVDEQIDAVRDLPGYRGVIDLNAFLHALRDVGYDGPVTAEPFSQRLRNLPADEAAAETSAAMHTMWQKAALSSLA